ncbi:MAG: MarR family transcriptional regulator [bacterium]|nr:MarR family transcriptional regulator [bacterium]
MQLRLALFLLFFLCLQQASAAIVSLTIYLYQDHAELTLTYCSKQIPAVVQLLPLQCRAVKEYSSVPVHVQALHCIFVQATCKYYTRSGLNVLVFDPPLLAAYTNASLYLLNYTPFAVKGLALQRYSNYYYAELSRPKIFLLAVQQPNGFPWLALLLLLFSAVLAYIAYWSFKQYRLAEQLEKAVLCLRAETDKKIVRYLLHRRQCYQHELVKVLGLDRSTACRALQRLEQLGVVQRFREKGKVRVMLSLNGLLKLAQQGPKGPARQPQSSGDHEGG